MVQIFNAEDYTIEKDSKTNYFSDFREELVTDLEGGFSAIDSEFENVYTQMQQKVIIFENAHDAECTSSATYQELKDMIVQLNDEFGIAGNSKLCVFRDLTSINENNLLEGEIRIYNFEAELGNGEKDDEQEQTLVFTCCDLETLYKCEIKIYGSTSMDDPVAAVFSETPIADTIDTVDFDEPSEEGNPEQIVNTDSLKTLFGKIAKWFSSFGTLAWKSNITADDITDDSVDGIKTKLNYTWADVGAQQVMASCTSITDGLLEIADNTEYELTGVTNLTIVGNTNSAHGLVTFASAITAPSYDESVSRFVSKMGDDITTAAGGETWEFDTMGGCIIWRKWDVST